jgi:hypothetical protein
MFRNRQVYKRGALSAGLFLLLTTVLLWVQPPGTSLAATSYLAPTPSSTQATGTPDASPPADTSPTHTGVTRLKDFKIIFYDWYANTPAESAAIAYPGDAPRHAEAAGTGTYQDPLTLAANDPKTSNLAPGTLFYIATFGKYFVMEDLCDDKNCDPQTPTLNLWLNNKDMGTKEQAAACSTSLQKNLVQVEVNPPASREVNTTPFIDQDGKCLGETSCVSGTPGTNPSATTQPTTTATSPATTQPTTTTYPVTTQPTTAATSSSTSTPSAQPTTPIDTLSPIPTCTPAATVPATTAPTSAPSPTLPSVTPTPVPTTPPTPTVTPEATSTRAPQESEQEVQVHVTGYGYPDNDPPGSKEIANPVLHKDGAGGTGTYDDPITFASADVFAPYGTKIYIPYLKRYFIREDLCASCAAGDEGRDPKTWVDLWVEGGEGEDSVVILNCESALTREKETIIINPAPDKPVIKEPLLSNGQCKLS